MMEKSLDEILTLKTQAKNRRDQELFDRAIKFLDMAIELAKKEREAAPTSAQKSRYASELADCYGMQGGIYRRRAMKADGEKEFKAEMLKSIRAYDDGYKYENDPQNNIVDSYNLLNRLISRILYNPAWFTDAQQEDIPEDVARLDMYEELAKARDVVLRQLRLERRGDVW